MMEFTLTKFNELARSTQAVPQTFTACKREGFEPEDGNEQRITIDHQLRVSPYFQGRQPPPEANWQELDSLRDRDLSVIIKFKYVGEQMPKWMAEAIEAAGIRDQRFSSKYRSSVIQVRKSAPAPE